MSTEKRRGRPPVPLIERIGDKLSIHTDLTPYVGHPEKVPSALADVHWIWEGALVVPERKVTIRRDKDMRHKPTTHRLHEAHIMPVRIRVNGKMKSVARILHNEIRGSDYPYTLRRLYEGCDWRCVNPFHLSYPKDMFSNGEAVPEHMIEESLDDILTGLRSEITEFIGTNGFNEAEVYEHFGLDYSEPEIRQALQQI